MKKISLLSLVVFLLFIGKSQHSQAQKITVIGTICDSATRLPLAFCNVAIVSKDKRERQLIGGTTNELGQFSLRRKFTQPKALLRATYIGYNDISLTLDFSKAKRDTLFLDTVFSSQTSKGLKDVVITAIRQRFELDADKLTMNNDDALSASSDNAFELLKKTPGVVIDANEDITLNGQSGVQFQFNGKDMKMGWTGVKTMLKSMSPKMIDKFEIINNPSAKYDADGGAGIINVKFVKNDHYGINGSVNAGVSHNNAWGSNAGGSLNYVDDKLSVSVHYGIDQDNNKSSSRSQTYKWKQTGDTMFFNSPESFSKSKSSGNNLSFSADYSIDSNNSIGSYVYWSGSGNSPFNNVSQTFMSYFPYTIVDSSYSNLNRTSYDNSNISGNLNYTHAFKRKDTRLTSDIDFSRSSYDNSDKYQMRYYYGNQDSIKRSEDLQNQNNEKSWSLSWKADFEGKIDEKNSIEVGVKTSYHYSDNDYNALTNKGVYGGTMVNDSSRMNQFKYLENINSLYVSYSFKPTKKYSFRLGLRGEQTNTKGEQKVGNQVHKNNYFNLFPNVRVGYMINMKNRISLSYTYRISRPSYSQLNPFLKKTSDYSYSQGNPDLSPEFTHNISMDYSLNFKWNFSFGYGYTKDDINSLPKTDPQTMVTTSCPDNIAFSQRLFLRVNTYQQVTSWWNLMLFGQCSYGRTESDDNNYFAINTINRNAWFFFMSSFELPYNFGLDFQGNFYYMQFGVYKNGGQGNFDVTLHRSFFKKTLRFSLGVSNIFAQKTTHSKYTYGYSRSESWNTYAGRGLYFNISYEFGKMYQRKTSLQKVQGESMDERSDGK